VTANQALELFASHFRSEPAGVWSAPGRANLIGEHTDYNDGWVLPFGINRRTWVAAAANQSNELRVVSSLDNSMKSISLAAKDRPENLDWALYPLGVAWMLREATPNASHFGIDLAVTTSVPIGAGLSSSAAIEMAVAVALNDIWNLNLTRSELAKVGQRAENLVVGAPTGIMDQMASVHAAADSAVLLDCRSLEVRQIPLGFAQRGLSIAVMDTRVKHSHGTSGYRERREQCEAASAALAVSALRDAGIEDLARLENLVPPVVYRRARHIVTENQRVLLAAQALESGNLEVFGELMNESHTSMRDDFEISIAELDLAVEVARRNGALGSRMTGGGFGGAAIALIASEKISHLAQTIEAEFAAAGFAKPEVFEVVPSNGAGRD
jgi:galactokinase